LKTKEKIVKLIVIFLTTVFFSLLFSMGYEIQAVTITGGVVDENGSPIQGITVNYGGNSGSTSGDGTYRVEGSGDIITYNFSGEDKYEAESASSEYFIPRDETEKYNIVLVKPESGYENEYQKIENMLSNCDVNRKEIITYSDSGFTANPKQVLGNIYNTTQKNIIIVLGTENMPEINFGIGSSNPPIIYKMDGGNAEQVKGTVRVINNAELLQEHVEKKAELKSETTTLETENSESNVTVKIKYPDKSQRITLKLKKKEVAPDPDPIEPDEPGLYVGNKITGTVLDIDNNPAEGVKVELCDKDGNTISAVTEQRTDENGNYTLSNVPGAGWDEVNLEVIPKDYIVKFTYGDKEQFEKADSVKYNGQDYESTFEEIKTGTSDDDSDADSGESGGENTDALKEPVDLYFVIDNSGSMSGTIKDQAKSGAKKFINNIYNDANYGENVNIGVIKFGNGASVLSDLESKEGKTNVGNAVDSIGANGSDTTTIISSGISLATEKIKAQSSGDRKKVMVILTDGIVTDINEPDNMKKSYLQAAEAGIDILTVLYNFTDQEKIFEADDRYEHIAGEWYYTDESTGEKYKVVSTAIEVMRKDILKRITAGQIVTADEGTIYDVLTQKLMNFLAGEDIGEVAQGEGTNDDKVETVPIKKEIYAEDDSTRRDVVNQYIQGGVDYSKGIELRKLDNYVSNEDYTDISNATHMTATAKVTIDTLDPTTADDIVNLKLKERTKITPELKKEVQSVKITLADGNVLIYKEGASDSPNDIGTMIVTPDRNAPEQFIAVMDDELLHGATMEIKYEVSIGGENWDIENSRYTVYDYIDEELSFKPYDPNNPSEKENEEWTIVENPEKETFTYLSIPENRNEAKYEVIKDKVIIKTELSGSNQEASFVVTRLLTTNSTDEYENYAEVVEYSNDLGRRIYKAEGSTNISYVPADLPLKEMYEGGLDFKERYENTHKQHDEAEAPLVNIIPPFGGESKVFENIIKYMYERKDFNKYLREKSLIK